MPGGQTPRSPQAGAISSAQPRRVTGQVTSSSHPAGQQGAWAGGAGPAPLPAPGVEGVVRGSSPGSAGGGLPQPRISSARPCAAPRAPTAAQGAAGRAAGRGCPVRRPPRCLKLRNGRTCVSPRGNAPASPTSEARAAGAHPPPGRAGRGAALCPLPSAPSVGPAVPAPPRPRALTGAGSPAG